MTDISATRARLLTVIEKVKRSVSQVRDRKERIGEAQTKASLISPMLEALGWDTSDIDEVSLEYRHTPQDNPVDYSLFLNRSPRLFVEAKALDTNLDDHKWRSQTVNYANAAGVEWCVLTDGNSYWIYNTHAPVAVEQKLFRTVVISGTDASEGVLDTLLLLSKEKVSGKAIDELWKAHFIDRSVQHALEGLFGDHDIGLVNLIRKHTPGLLPAQIRDSLRRADFRIDFPALTVAEQPPLPPVENLPPCPADSTSSGRGTLVKVADLIAAGLVKSSSQWRVKTSSMEARCEVMADGTLLVDGRSFRSPSGAGQAATGWRACDGWRLWEYQDEMGQWRSVDDLRRRFSEANSEMSGATDVTTAPEASNAPTTPVTTGNTTEARLAGRPTAQALFRTLVQQANEAIGEFPIHANSKHIIFSNKHAFAAVSVLKSGLRIGLHLASSEAEHNSRLRAQPRGIFEGWSALHVSITVLSEADVDQELLNLLRKAHGAAD